MTGQLGRHCLKVQYNILQQAIYTFQLIWCWIVLVALILQRCMKFPFHLVPDETVCTMVIKKLLSVYHQNPLKFCYSQNSHREMTNSKSLVVISFNNWTDRTDILVMLHLNNNLNILHFLFLLYLSTFSKLQTIEENLIFFLVKKSFQFHFQNSIFGFLWIYLDQN